MKRFEMEVAYNAYNMERIFFPVIVGLGQQVTDGIFPEAKEFLLGYWIVDVASPERAYAIAGRISGAPGPGGVPTNMPIEIRRFASHPEGKS